MIVSPEYQEREFYILEITSTGSFTCWKTCSRRIGSNPQWEEAVLQVLGRARSGHLWKAWSLHMVMSVNSLNKHPSQCTNTESLTKKNKDLSTKDEVLREYQGSWRRHQIPGSQEFTHWCGERSGHCLWSSMELVTLVFRAKEEGVRKRGRWQTQTPLLEERGEEATKVNAAAPRQASSVMRVLRLHSSSFDVTNNFLRKWRSKLSSLISRAHVSLGLGLRSG